MHSQFILKLTVFSLFEIALDLKIAVNNHAFGKLGDIPFDVQVRNKKMSCQRQSFARDAPYFQVKVVHMWPKENEFEENCI